MENIHKHGVQHLNLGQGAYKKQQYDGDNNVVASSHQKFDIRETLSIHFD